MYIESVRSPQSADFAEKYKDHWSQLINVENSQASTKANFKIIAKAFWNIAIYYLKDSYRARLEFLPPAALLLYALADRVRVDYKKERARVKANLQLGKI